MKELKKKLDIDYWLDKLKLKENQPIVKRSLQAKFLTIPLKDFSYLKEITQSQYLSECTVYLCIYGVLCKRYFTNFEGGVLAMLSEEFILNKQPLFLSLTQNIDSTLKSCLQQTQNELQTTYGHRNYDTQQLLEKLSQPSLSVYSQFGFGYNGSFSENDSNLGFQLNMQQLDSGELKLKVEYDTAYVSEQVAEHFINNFHLWIKNLKSYLSLCSDEIRLVNDTEKKYLLNDLVGSSLEKPYASFLELFKIQAKNNPKNNAVIFENFKISYKELDDQSNQLADYLINLHNIKSGDLVSIKLERTEWLVLSILAVLKAGTAYVPIDPNYPSTRIAFIEADSNCKLTIDSKLLSIFKSKQDSFSKETPELNIKSDSLSHVIYTSGSTGKPKGVQIKHYSVSALLSWSQKEFENTNFEIAYAVTSQCFDLSVFEMFYPLSIGKAIRVLENGLEIPSYLSNDKKILINTVPSVIQSLADIGTNFDNVVALNMAGEPVPISLTHKLPLEKVEVRNLYGPSEDTTYSSCFKIEKPYDYSIPIGTPLPETQFYILSEKQLLQPLGVIGELCISGDGLSRGYLNRPELTKEKFISHPFIEGKVLYKTGDLARWMPDGNVEFIGRKDHQIKLRGYRIELGEIEHALEKEEKISRAIVQVKSINDVKQIVSYYQLVSKTDVISKEELQVRLAKNLPAYMVPKYFISLEKLPLLPNGKVDKKSLPAMKGSQARSSQYCPAQTELEKIQVKIWKSILGIEKIGIEDNFFDLGGHSLQVGQVINQMHKELDKTISYKAFFLNSNIKAISKNLSDNHYYKITPAPVQESYPLTASQNRLWVLSQLEGGSLAYNISALVELTGELNAQKFEAAFKYLINRYEIFRTAFLPIKDGTIHQFIKSENEVEFKLERKNYSSSKNNKKAVEFAVDNYIQEASNLVFNLEEAPLVKGHLVKVEKNKHFFLLIMHHIIADGWSVEILINEISKIYNSLLNEESVSLADLKFQYKDYVFWLKEGKRINTESEKYWLSQFSGSIPALELHHFNKRPLVQTSNGNSLTHSFDTGLLKGLKQLSISNEATLFMTLVAGINALLHRYSNQNDIVVGTPIAGREHPDLENQIGLYLNTLAIRTKIEEEDSFKILLSKEKETLLSAYEHQDYPFDELVEKLNLNHDTSRSALFDVMVVLQNQNQLNNFGTEANLDGLQIKQCELERNTAQFDLTFTFVENESLELNIEYNTDIYDGKLVSNIFLHLDKMFKAVIVDPSIKIAEIDYLSDKEKTELIADVNDTDIDYYPTGKTLVELFEEQVVQSGGETALVFEGEEISYTALNKRVNCLANYLRTKYEIIPDDLIGVKLERGVETIVAVLAILKSGAAYVPMDIDYPVERIEYLKRDSKCKLVIDEKELVAFNKASDDFSETNPVNINKENDLAYIIYTSGTTGKPKGVMIEHRNVVNLVNWFCEHYNINTNTRAIQLTELTFDPSVEDLFATLLSGGVYHLISKDLLGNVENLRAYIIKNKISILNYVPQFLNDLLACPKIKSLETVISGGEKIAELIKENILSKGYSLYNNYGPTEITVDCLSDKMNANSVSIGRPIANVSAFILDDKLNVVPKGVRGNLYISGAGVARGYLYQPELSQQKFITNPFDESEKMYDTGDVCRFLKDGRIEFLGREDQQVKIRGQRIELGEIESVFISYSDNIKQVVVTAKEMANEKVLIAYFVANEELSKSAIRTFLCNYLPYYMIPSYFIEVEDVPMTSNGKTDFDALPKVSDADLVENAYIAPENETQEKLVRIWEALLDKEKIGIGDNFFELGGHSLKVAKLVNLIYQDFNIKVSYSELFTNYYIKDQANLISTKEQSAYQHIAVIPEQESYALSSSQRRLWVLSQFEEGNIAYNMPGVFTLKGSIDFKALEKAFIFLIDRHESLRTVFSESKEGDINQWIQKTINFKLHYTDLSKNNNNAKEVNAILKLQSEFQFDLSKGPLLNAKLIKVEDESFVFSFVMHHIISDGWSMEIMTNEIFRFYSAFVNESSMEVEPLKIQYKDYASWQQQALDLEEMEMHKKYWLEQFEGEISVLDLPSTYTRPKIKTYTGKSLKKQFEPQDIKSLKALCQSEGCTLFMGLMSAIKILFYRYTGQKDIVIGSPIAGRENIELEDQVGFYVNTLALRTQFEGTDSFSNVVSKVKETMLGAYEHQAYPFDELVEQLPIKRDLSRNPLFDVIVTNQNTDKLKVDVDFLEDIEVSSYECIENIVSKFDLEFIFDENNDGLNLQLNYNTDIYSEEFVEQLVDCFDLLVKDLVKYSEAPINSLNYLSEKVCQRILFDFNNTESIYPKTKTLVDLFINETKKNPNKIAVKDENKEYTYDELNTLSDQVAIYLNQTLGDRITPIGILLDRSVEMLVVTLGIFKSGRIYIPLDPNFPTDRLKYIIKDSQTNVLISEEKYSLEYSENVTIINLSTLLKEAPKTKGALNRIVSNNATAYIIYTSGSTGNPKGVEIGHQSLLNFLDSMRQSPGFESSDVLFSVTTYSFDISVLELFVPIISGGSSYIANQAILSDPNLIIEKLSEIKPTIIQATPSFYEILFDSGWEGDQDLKVLCGGDAMTELLAEKLILNTKVVWNMYGPTETTIWSSCKKIEKHTDASIIGKPINNTQFYILDESLNLLPIGANGSIFIGGDGLAKGYYNNTDLTNEKFIPNPFRPGSLIYEAGDVGKWNECGEIIFAGRNDRQIKIRGYRIELGDIERSMLKLPQLESVVAVVKKDVNGVKRIVSYFTTKKGLAINDLKSQIKKYLPDYMIPSYFVKLDKIPLTLNGKTDRKYLTNKEDADLSTCSEYIAPRNEIETKLEEIWSEVLGLKKISVQDDFFELGGHSLIVAQVINRIYKRLEKGISFKSFFTNSTIEKLSKELIDSKYASIPNAPVAESYPLTASQHRLWILSQLDGGDLAYNMPSATRLIGDINADFVERIFIELVNRHEILRTTFQLNESGEIRQYIRATEQLDFKLEIKDLRKKRNKAKAVAIYLKEANAKTFDLENGPLIRISLIKLKKDESIFFLSMHHIVGDGWSQEVLVSELVKNYNALLNNEVFIFPKLKIQYKDYAFWQNENLQNKKFEKAEQFWLDQFSGEVPVLDLPSFQSRPLVQTFNGATLSHQYPSSFLQKIKDFSIKNDATLFMTLMSGVNALLYRYTNQTDIILGTPIAGREHPELENQIGLYLNTLAIRTKVDADGSFLELLKQEKNLLLDAHEYQAYPFDKLIEKLDLKRDLSRSALFDVIVVLQNQNQLNDLNTEMEFDGLRVSEYKLENHTAQFDLSFVFQENDEGLKLELLYNTAIYDSFFIEKIFAHLENILSSSINNIGSLIGEISYLTEEEKHQVLINFNDTEVYYPKEKTIIDLFESQVLESPNSTALVFEGISLSYAELNHVSNQLARYLLDNYVVKPDDFIGVFLDNSQWSIVSILAILKSGAAYVPLDITYPDDRVLYIREDINAILLINESELSCFQEVQEKYDSSNLNIEIKPQNLAYVIYTSGTTGNPKGVMAEHKNVVSLASPCSSFTINSNFILLSTGSISFDATIIEYFGTLLNGGKLVISSKEKLLDFDSLANLIKSNDVNAMWMTSSWFNQVVTEKINVFSPINQLIVGGDVVSPNHIEILQSKYPNINVINGYGPTENTTFSTTYLISENIYTSIPIGKPLPNSQAYILDDRFQPVPIGVEGKLYLAGEGVTRGYLNKPEITKQKFVKNPFLPESIMYDTGDICRFRPDGNIEFFGRKDQQVKLRGFRIELEEIDSILLKQKNVTHSVTEVKEQEGERVLVSYIVCKEEVDKQVLRLDVKRILPDYMVPSYIIELEQIPLTSNGKVDRKALPNIEASDLIRKEYKAASNKIEKEFISIWENVLGVEKIGVTDNFFELGGNSLTVAQVINRINKRLGKSLSFKAFFSNPIIEKLSKGLTSDEYFSIPKIPISASYPVTSSQHRLWILSQLEGGDIAYNMPSAVKLVGEVNADLVEQIFIDIAKRHEILRTTFGMNESDEVRQYIHSLEELDFNLERKDFSKKKNKLKAVSNYLQERNSRAFNLEKGPLVEISLIKLKKLESIFYLSMHHIIGDGWSQEVLIAELVKRYNALLNKKGAVFPELSIQYKDYTVWQNENLQNKKHQKAEQYWLGQFADEIPVLDLPSYQSRPLIQTFNGSILSRQYSSSLLQKLKDFSNKHGVTLFMTLMAGVKALLYRYSNQKDVIVGTPIAGRAHPELEHQIGLYLNTLAIRTKIDSSQSFLKLLNQEKKLLLNAYEYQVYPFDNLVDKLNLKRDLSRSALFDVMVVLQNQNQLKNLKTETEFDGLEVLEYKLESKTAKFDLNFMFRENDGELELDLLFNTDIYNNAFAEQFVESLEMLLNEITKNPEIAVESIEIITVNEKNNILSALDNTNIEYPTEKSIIDLFEEQVLKTPNSIAIKSDNDEFSYEKIKEEICGLASYLIKECKVEKGDCIGVKLSRTEWLPVSLLAVLKTGAAYVPIDPMYPAERINFIEEDSNCKIIIDADLIENYEKNKVEYLSENISVKINSKDLAYIIYTSGSTGKPKGVMLSHTNAVAMLCWAKDEFRNTLFETMYAVTSHCFDLSVYELFYPLTVGKTVRLLPDGLSIPEYLWNDDKVLINTVPSVIQTLSNSREKFEGAVAINMAGEPIPVSLSHSLPLDKIEVRNLYGPSEDTTYSSCFRVKENYTKSIPIGKPVSNTVFYILSESLQLQPKGVIGELCISGAGLSSGYWNREELTAEKFVPNPFDEGEKMYLTGDLAKLLEDGNIEFIGRKDHQVKLRGYRIELGEIDYVLLNQVEITQAITVVKKQNDKSVLVSYIVSKEAIDKQNLRLEIKKLLPNYMMPGYIIELETLPLTPNGKIDRKSLPDVEGVDLIRGEYKPASNKAEQVLVSIWEEVLGIEKVGITDDFFELGGNSLIVAQVINRIYKKLGKSISFKSYFTNPTIEKLSKGLKDDKYNSIPNAPVAESYPLAQSQHRLWILSQLEGGDLAYNMPSAVKLVGKINTRLLKRVYVDIVNRHEILRTTFMMDDSGEIRQYIRAINQHDFSLKVKDFRKKKNQSKAVSNYLKKVNTKAFNLKNGPLIRASLIKIKKDESIFFLSMHHIIGDGWSQEVLVSELLKNYNALVNNQVFAIPELRIQYKDYAVWQNENLQNKKHQKAEDYWLSQFSDEIPVLELPSYQSRPLIQTFNGSILSRQYSSSLLQKLKYFSNKNDVTLFMTLMAAINALLHRYSNQNDIIIGTPIAGREHPDLERQIGLYLNTLAIRTKIDSNLSFIDLLKQEKELLLNAYEYQTYPFDKLVSKLDLKRDLSRSALFDVMVVLQNQSQLNNLNTDIELDGLRVSEYKLENHTAQFDLSFVFKENDEGLKLELLYNTNIFNYIIVEQFINSLEILLNEIIIKSEIAVDSIEILTLEGKNNILSVLDNRNIDYPTKKTIIDLFEEQAIKTPGLLAIISDNYQYSYKNLKSEIDGLASYLIGNYQIEKGDRIGVKLERTEWLPVSLLAVLKTGAAYVPIDPHYPADRIKFIEEDSKCKIIIDLNLLENYKKNRDEYLGKNITVKINSKGLAYIIYTSGSTGKPKGVMLSHTNAVAMLCWAKEEFRNTPFETMYAVTSHCFDLSVYELFYPLTVGKKVRLLPNGLAIPDYLQNDNDVLINTVPSVIQTLSNGGEKFDGAVAINMAGEPIPVSLSHSLPLDKIEVRNLYGPSEDTTYSSCFRIKENYTKSIPIGKPVSNTVFYILSESLQLQPKGVIGELCIAGSGLSSGYWNREELTVEKFVPDPFNEGEKMYLTGDLARILPDGNLEFIGRKDHQIKLRGYRIELGEVDHALLKQDEITEAVTIVKDQNEESVLVSYIASKGTIDKQDLRLEIKKLLPDYMVPSYIIELERLPLTANGKIDRKALPSPTKNDLVRREFVLSKTETEQKLVSIWKGVLNIENVGITDNFFELGGHSLHLTQMIAEINKTFKIKLQLKLVFSIQNIQELAELVDNEIIFNQGVTINQEEEEVINNNMQIWEI